MMIRLARFVRDRRGVSAVEFAMLAPVMIGIYLAMAEFCQGFMAQKRMGHISAMVADMVAQEDVLDTDGLDAILGIGPVIMKPFPTTTLKQRVSSVTRGTDGVVKVDWSYAQGMTARSEGESLVVPGDLIVNGESLVMAESTYDYESLADYLLPGLTRFSQTYYLRPRTANMTSCTNC